MFRLHSPTGLMLVGASLISLLVVMGIATAESGLNVNEPLNKIKEFESSSLGHKQNYGLGKLELSGGTVYFPWASRTTGLGVRGPSIALSLPPVSEELVLNGSRARAQVHDLKAINGVAKRDIIYEESQNNEFDPSSLVNSLEVRVSGKDLDEKEWEDDSFGRSNIEGLVDSAINSREGNSSIDKRLMGFGGLKQLGNNMDIDVSGISVSAINTVEGGSAVATSNIVIKPIQVIVYPSEVDEKLK